MNNYSICFVFCPIKKDIGSIKKKWEGFGVGVICSPAELAIRQPEIKKGPQLNSYRAQI
jgi:hypothetical protein